MNLIKKFKLIIDFLVESKSLHEMVIEDNNSLKEEKCYFLIDNLKKLDINNGFKLKIPLVNMNQDNLEINEQVYIPEISKDLLEYDIYSDYYLLGIIILNYLIDEEDLKQNYKDKLNYVFEKTIIYDKKEIYNLFFKCFVDGEINRINRPNENDYLKVFNYYYNQMIVCPNCNSILFIEDVVKKNNLNFECSNCHEKFNLKYFAHYERIYRDRSLDNIKINELVSEKLIGFSTIDRSSCNQFIVIKKNENYYINSNKIIKIWLKRDGEDFCEITEETNLIDKDEIFVEKAFPLSTFTKKYNYILVVKYFER